MKFNWKAATKQTLQLVGLIGMVLGVVFLLVGLFRGLLSAIGIGGALVLVGLYIIIGFNETGGD